jgi:hypothetical protein
MMTSNVSGPVSSMNLLSLPDELIQSVFSFVDAKDLGLVEITCAYFRTITSPLWKLCCDKDFSSFPRYRCQTNGYYGKDSYKLTYEWLFREVKRARITNNDLETLDWYFNFLPSAGGRGRFTLMECVFDQQFLTIPPFPILPYSIQEDGLYLQVSEYPLHDIERLPDGEWLIKNDAVTIVSCAGYGGTLRYQDRGFQ